MTLRKYPRTRHIEGSRLQPGDFDLDAVPFAKLAGRPLVVEEKLDGANAGLGFDGGGRLRLQSRGHFLDGGARENQFPLFKAWAHAHAEPLRCALGDRYILYGEWLYAKHTIAYDRLPHYFLEFDALDRHSNSFLSTDRRRELLAGTPVRSVPVLWTGRARALEELSALVGPSLYKGPAWRDRLDESARAQGLDPSRVRAETDPTDLMEGLYLKVEEEGRVVGRYKYVRSSFLTCVLDSGSHWLARPIVPNRLADGVDLFASGGPA